MFIDVIIRHALLQPLSVGMELSATPEILRVLRTSLLRTGLTMLVCFLLSVTVFTMSSAVLVSDLVTSLPGYCPSPLTVSLPLSQHGWRQFSYSVAFLLKKKRLKK